MGRSKHGVVGIASDTLDTVLELARDSHPKGFTAYLQSREATKLGIKNEGRIITEVIFSPRMNRGNVFSVLGIDTLPRGSVVGSVRGKPGEDPALDEDDYERFSDLGSRHIIVWEPYNRESWVCYDHTGTEVELEVYSVDFGDEEFDLDT